MINKIKNNENTEITDSCYEKLICKIPIIRRDGSYYWKSMNNKLCYISPKSLLYSEIIKIISDEELGKIIEGER